MRPGDYFIQKKGIRVPPEPYNWMGCSPEGILYMVRGACDCGDGMELVCMNGFLLEIKTPWKERDERRVRRKFYDEEELPDSSGIFTPCRPYYSDQCQGCCNSIGCVGVFFCVLRPDAMQVTFVPSNSAYWHNTLLPNLCKFWKELTNREIEQGKG